MGFVPHNIAITDTVWCIAYKGRVGGGGGGGGGVLCATVVQHYCTSVGIAGGEGNQRMIGSFTKVLK